MRSALKTWPFMLILALGGGGLFLVLVVKHGASAVGSATNAVGWGLGLVVLSHFLPLIMDVLSWSALLPRGQRPAFASLLAIRWMGESVSSMLPVAQVGGEVVRVRLAAARGVPLPAATASVVAGMTVSLGTQIVFTLSGLMLLAFIVGGNNWLGPALVGSLVAVVAAGGFLAVQHYGIFRMMGAIAGRVLGSHGPIGLARRGEELDAAIRQLYAQRSAILRCCGWTMCVWLAASLETWIALKALGVDGTYGDAFVLESASQGIRSAAFLVPGALGVQEAGYLIVGGMLGMSPATALALALIRRVRELAFGVPGVLAWQWTEGFDWWKRRWSAQRTAGKSA
jgi:putative membrane protein